MYDCLAAWQLPLVGQHPPQDLQPSMVHKSGGCRSSAQDHVTEPGKAPSRPGAGTCRHTADATELQVQHSQQFAGHVFERGQHFMSNLQSVKQLGEGLVPRKRDVSHPGQGTMAAWKMTLLCSNLVVLEGC